MKVIIRNKTSIESWIEEKVRMLFGSFQWCGVHYILQMENNAISKHTLILLLIPLGQRPNTALPNRGGIHLPI